MLLGETAGAFTQIKVAPPDFSSLCHVVTVWGGGVVEMPASLKNLFDEVKYKSKPH